MSTDRMYCPSTDEVIFAPDYEEINENAEAFIAYWHGEVLTEPLITDAKLESAWNEYYKKWEESGEEDLDIWEAVEKFFRSYRNSKWKVLECTFHGMACGPVSTTVYFVVKSDTIIEEDPAPGKNPYEGMSEKEIEEEILRKQIRSLLK
jgi:hypothetical protein